MAIALDIALLSGGVGEGKTRYSIPELPVVKVYHVTAVGVTNIAVDGARFIQLRSKAGSDPVHLRMQLDAVTTQAAVADDGTITIDPGERLLFGLTEDVAASAFEFDVRAVA